MRKEYVLNILRRDRFKLRRLIPRKFKQLAFDLITFLSRALYQQKNRKLNQEILENNYKVIKDNVSKSIDILAICRYLK